MDGALVFDAIFTCIATRLQHQSITAICKFHAKTPRMATLAFGRMISKFPNPSTLICSLRCVRGQKQLNQNIDYT